jgi:hypothetical protein
MELTQKELHDIFTYHEDGYLVWKLRTKTAKLRSLEGKIAGTIRAKDSYTQIAINKKKYQAHRLIWIWHYGEIKKQEIDHIDGNPKNNRIENLREATYSENKKNLKMYKTNTSGYSGICFDKSRKKWFVSISINNKLKNIGRFEKIEDAINARKIAEENHFGFWARKPYPIHLINKALELTGDLCIPEET